MQGTNMCTVVLGIKAHPEVPLLLAANRDEWLARPTAPFGQLQAEPAIYGGKDLRSGGTWFAIRPDGAIAVVANVRPGQSTDPKKKSRGELPLLLLGGKDLATMLDLAKGINVSDYNPFNLMFGNGNEWYILRGDGEKSLTAIEPGLHVLGNVSLDASDDAKTDYVKKELADIASVPTEGLAERMSTLLAQEMLCLDAGPYATRWSMVYLGRAKGDGALGIAEAGVQAGPLKKVRVPR
jgi:uncharacterized protein with NRDE domain